MLYGFTVYEGKGEQRKKIFESEVAATNLVNALERACIRLGPGRIVEMRQIDDIYRPKVCRVDREGLG